MCIIEDVKSDLTWFSKPSVFILITYHLSKRMRLLNQLNVIGYVLDMRSYQKYIHPYLVTPPRLSHRLQFSKNERDQCVSNAIYIIQK